MLTFDKIVNKLLKKGGKVFLKSDIFELIDPEKKEQYKAGVDKLIYRLKAQGILISMKAGVYVVPSEDDKTLNKVDLIEKYYLRLIKKYITYYVGNAYYISGKKALEFHMKNGEIPEKIFIVNRSLNKKIKFGNLEVIFKTVSGKDNGKKINLYSKLSEYVVDKEIEGLIFKISNLELSLIEAALLNDTLEGIPVDLLNKTIKKYSKILNTDIFYDIGQFKFIMSFNRLKEIAKNIDYDLYLVFLDIIKKNGGLFIGEGLRGF
ncbi:hypothetical protein A9Q91_04445 [Candidatus Gracilibacteria bacterium 28_42_T64]|nr:hypothetical protein A9Q91_04445 [Candidatus Gracilibacteria bacterium 28_42_T64]